MDSLSSSQIADCRFGSVVSKTHGEDSIGSATPCDQWLILEVPQPADGFLPWEQGLSNKLGLSVRSLFSEHRDRGIPPVDVFKSL